VSDFFSNPDLRQPGKLQTFLQRLFVVALSYFFRVFSFSPFLKLDKSFCFSGWNLVTYVIGIFSNFLHVTLLIFPTPPCPPVNPLAELCPVGIRLIFLSLYLPPHLPFSKRLAWYSLPFLRPDAFVVALFHRTLIFYGPPANSFFSSDPFLLDVPIPLRQALPMY